MLTIYAGHMHEKTIAETADKKHVNFYLFYPHLNASHTQFFIIKHLAPRLFFYLIFILNNDLNYLNKVLSSFVRHMFDVMVTLSEQTKGVCSLRQRRLLLYAIFRTISYILEQK